MKHLAPLSLVLAVLAAPAFAFSIDMTLPNLTFPDDPVTQGCSDPVTLTATCAPGR